MTTKEMDMPARGSVRWWTVKRTIEEEYCVSAPDAETAKRHAAHFELPSKVVTLNATATPYEEKAPKKVPEMPGCISDLK